MWGCICQLPSCDLMGWARTPCAPWCLDNFCRTHWPSPTRRVTKGAGGHSGQRGNDHRKTARESTIPMPCQFTTEVAKGTNWHSQCSTDA